MSPLKEGSIKKKLITQERLLKLLKLGALLTVAVTAPNAIAVLKPFLKKEKHWKEYYPFSVNKTLLRLYRKGQVKVSENKKGYVVRLTKKGKTELLRFDLENMEIKIPDRWDKKWRLVFFDVPEKFKRQRNFLSLKLKNMNFYLMQDSVFIHPFPCQKEIEFLREVLGIPHFVKLGLLENVENREELEKIFKPLLKETF
ncbi:MAG: hypothetical protein M1120_02415 [Patescibacteria group bacterium]|nr:hypothetical protein [Patescibacteria group bacterium]